MNFRLLVCQFILSKNLQCFKVFLHIIDGQKIYQMTLGF